MLIPLHNSVLLQIPWQCAIASSNCQLAASIRQRPVAERLLTVTLTAEACLLALYSWLPVALLTSRSHTNANVALSKSPPVVHGPLPVVSVYDCVNLGSPNGTAASDLIAFGVRRWDTTHLFSRQHCAGVHSDAAH
jgi:hypothetical protein